ncbi:DUF928 domain-containing protein [Acaryochloris sp. IP29b_bin.137]|uniref:DUF928 domain-containing protein n=1 Tax=Acaryochloris sp. IP29b_bin.137 TaxID=2969217 RepID=UPI0026260CE2|nr:DUF928 domain-containing protein [Acaryochloris sp. IP29b_bin.137]
MSKYCSTPAKRIAPLAVGGLAALGSALPSYAEFKPPGDLDKPGNRRGLATRAIEPQPKPLNESTPRRPSRSAPIPLPRPDAPPIWELPDEPATPPGPGQPKTCVASGQPTLTTLVPKSNMGLSATAFPTFYWFTPTHSYRILQFSLYEVGAEGRSREEVYSTTFQASGKAGLSRISIPNQDTTLALKPETDYQWVVGLFCTRKGRNGIIANGWVRHTPPTQEVAKTFSKSKLKDQADAFAEAGYWYDAVQALAAARREKPEDRRLNQTWKALFESEVVQLSEIAAQQ